MEAKVQESQVVIRHMFPLKTPGENLPLSLLVSSVFWQTQTPISASAVTWPASVFLC